MYSKNDLIQHLINCGAMYSNNIIEAFKNIDRVDFVVDQSVSDIYEDYPLHIGYNQTISQPRTVAMMMEMLEPKEGQKILDIGSGSGWTTALLSFIVGDSGSVLGMERITELVRFGNSNLEKYKFKNTTIIQAGDELGMVGKKFDRILVSASARELPIELTEQLNIGGKLVIPVGNAIYEIKKRKSQKIKCIFS